MRRIIKSLTSLIISNGYMYPVNHREILTELDKEQDHYCAYCEEYLTPGFSREVEHFNPNLKNTAADGYNNWFSVSGKLNRAKGSKPRWNRHQPLMDPTSPDLEKRLIYDNGDYILFDPNDTEADNLRNFLFLNDFEFPVHRRKFIDSLRYLLISAYGNDLTKLEAYLRAYPEQVRYRTAIKKEFGINL